MAVKDKKLALDATPGAAVILAALPHVASSRSTQRAVAAIQDELRREGRLPVVRRRSRKP